MSIAGDQGVEASSERFGGIAFMASGGLFLAKSVLDLVVGHPPAIGTQLLAWASSHQVSLAFTNEVLFFAAVLLIPAVPVLYRRLDGSNHRAVGFGCGVLLTVIPIMLVLVIVHGRLVYPVFGIDVAAPDSIASSLPCTTVVRT